MVRSFLTVYTVLLFCLSVSGRSVRRDVGYSWTTRQSQVPLSPAATDASLPSPSRAISITLGITVASDSEEQIVELPLRQSMSCGSHIPGKPKTARVIALAPSSQTRASSEQLDNIICRVRAVFSEEERAGFHLLSMHEPSWPWFKLEDGIVDFEEPTSRWFLAGREIESFECR